MPPRPQTKRARLAGLSEQPTATGADGTLVVSYDIGSYNM
jgi:hypothetical protein